MDTQAHGRRLNFIGGEFLSDENWFEDRAPSDDRRVVGRFPDSSAATAERAVEAAQAALDGWSDLGPIARGAMLDTMADRLVDRGEEIVRAMVEEQGKLIHEARGELGKGIEYMRYYAGMSWEYGGRAMPSSRPGVELGLRRQPVGVCALVTPWNVPFAIPLRKIAPALLAGNTVVVKPSSETPLTCHLIAEAAVEAGLPEGVINVVYGRGGTAARAICSHPATRAISFTGSTAVGRELAVLAAGRLIKVQLELGGKNAAVVLDDADLDLAVDRIVAAAYGSSGQQCTATSRVIATPGVIEPLTRKLVDRVASLRVGIDETAQVGPLVSERQMNTVLEYVGVGWDEGATLAAGGTRLEADEFRHGWFVSPALFTGVTPDMRIAREEIFGPVVAVMAAVNDDEALRIANDSDYGLSAAVYTTSLARAARFLDGLEAGAVAVNLPSAGWEVQTAFGGLKESGGSGWKEQGIETLDFFSDLKATQVMAG